MRLAASFWRFTTCNGDAGLEPSYDHLMIDFLAALPLWVLWVVLNVLLMGIGLGGMYVARRWVIPWMGLRYQDAYAGAAVVQSVMVLYGLIAALTTVSVWSKHSQVDDLVSAEATAIAGLWRDFSSYPEPLRGQLQDTLRDYTDQIINNAWPQQQQRKIPKEGVVWMNQLQAQLFAFEPGSDGKRVAHAETLRAFNVLVHARRQRLDAVSAGLPNVLWIVLFPGAIGCVLLSLLFRINSVWFQGTLVVSLAGFLSMNLFVIIAMDRPFQGEVAIGPESYQLIYDQLMKK